MYITVVSQWSQKCCGFMGWPEWMSNKFFVTVWPYITTIKHIKCVGTGHKHKCMLFIAIYCYSKLIHWTLPNTFHSSVAHSLNRKHLDLYSLNTLTKMRMQSISWCEECQSLQWGPVLHYIPFAHWCREMGYTVGL